MEETATFGGGCYWCLEAYYQRVAGVFKVVSGYSAGTVDNPTAQRVYQGDTGHAEVVQITYDSSLVTYRELLEIFFVMHDPTTLNKQGHDVGDEYRSIILTHSKEQEDIAQAVMADYAQPLYKDPIVTQVQPYEVFWPADGYMQDYYNQNPNAGYCLAVIDPKLQKLRKEFANKLKD